MKIKFSCVLDYSPLMAAQTYIWVESLQALNISSSDIYIHIIGEIPEDLLTHFETKKINIVRAKPYDERNKYCNKLVQFNTFKSLEYDYVLLMDCDTAIVSLEDLRLENEVYAKIVDYPRPSRSILKLIFNEAGLIFKETNASFVIGEECITDVNNCNGGVYMINNSIFKNLTEAWETWANWCIENAHLFTPEYEHHADQVGFALAMSSMGRVVTPLNIEWNYPTHLGKQNLPNIKPNILHYHSCINEHMRLNPIGIENVDNQIQRINEIIANSLKNNFSNRVFWNLRYAMYPELGSGVGSRGAILKYKKELIGKLTHTFKDRSIIDVGCGDLELMRHFDFKDYLGIDISEESLRVSKEKRPNWEFHNGSIEDNHVPTADLVMCFDVLIHQSSKEKFEATVKHIVEKSTNRIIIGAYNEIPSYGSEITYYYNAIIDEVKKYKKFNEIAILGKYRDVSVLVGTKHKNIHERDMKSSDLNRAFSEVIRPDLLQYLVDVSRLELGFYTSHYPRVFEYSWLLERLELQRGKRVLDIGAGVCPLPICLDNFGLEVTTIDSHHLNRSNTDRSTWNEWGFLNYGNIRSGIKSLNIDFAEFKTTQKYDFIYSISVVEHMPAITRRKVIDKAANLLKKGGRILLTIDVIPNTDRLWNRSEDIEVESAVDHGTVNTLKQELIQYGFEIDQEFMQRDIFNSRTDVYYVEAVKIKNKNWFKFFMK